ncbi:MAG: ATP-binding protein [Thermoanaerobaculia bacterium]|nr:ATP-binding protein [Thermoanaerobaculia bacterium]
MMSDNHELFPEAKSRSKGSRRRSKGTSPVVKGRVKVHDPFELIRWLALSQPDPRKALAELVQNSLDAGAQRIRVTRIRERGIPCLKILDDGEGVLPELDRLEALRYIATNIGHSRKRRLSPEERLTLMTQGQYGIGLLGFWSLGQILEMRSAVAGQHPHRLVLHRDRPEFTIEKIRRRNLFDDRWTEVVVVDLHPQAKSALVGRRAADFLADELRGQLLDRDVELVVEDRMSRGRAEKILPVQPRRFLGEPIVQFHRLPIAGFPDVQLELYLRSPSTEEGPSHVALYAGGTLASDSFAELSALDLAHSPWTHPRLTGMIDFPGLRIPPGSRRGVVPDAAAETFAHRLRELEPRLMEILEEDQERRSRELDQRIVKDLQRAFQGFFRERPRYRLLPVDDPTLGSGRTDEDGVVGSGSAPGVAVPMSTDVQDQERDSESLSSSGPSISPTIPFPPGPLHALTLPPSPLRLRLGGRRLVRARAVDRSGREVDGDVSFRWRLVGATAQLSEVDPAGPQVQIIAGEVAGEATLNVFGWTESEEASAVATIEVFDEPMHHPSRDGIPEPTLIDDPGATWRSRLVDGRWEVNSGHTEFRDIDDRPAVKLRYLSLLFAKEVVLRSALDPRLEGPLEQLVEIASYADRHMLRGRRAKT